MSSLRAIHLTSIDELRAAAAAWDDLWWQSDVALPTTRAELIAQWVEQFHPKASFHVVAVEADGRWIAALPLVGCHVGWMIPAGGLPSNSWSPSGELLLDTAVEPAVADAAMDVLLASANRLPWQLLWLNDTVPETSRWRALLRACRRAGIPSAHHERYRVGRVEIGHDWESYQRRLPKSHRQQMNRVARRLGGEGDLQFELCSRLELPQVEARLQAMFEVEHRSWKGRAGTSVLSTPGIFPFFVRQAEQLAQWGQLEIASLRLNDRVIAFVHGFRAKDVYFAHKIGYDPEFADFSPGQLLFYRLLERLHNDGEVRALDFVGPLSESLSRWRPETYGVGRIAIGLRRPLGRVAMYAYRNWWPRMRQLRARLSSDVGNPVAKNPVTEPAGV